MGNSIVERQTDDKVHEANMGPTWVLVAPDGPLVYLMNLVIRDGFHIETEPYVQHLRIQNSAASGIFPFLYISSQSLARNVSEFFSTTVR